MADNTHNPVAFRRILKNLISVDNEARATAESLYESYSVSEKFSLLLNEVVYSNTIPVEEIELAAVLLRRLLTSTYEVFFSKLGAVVKNRVKSELLLRIQQQFNHNLRRKIGDVVAELARFSIDDAGNNQWPEFLQYLYDSACSPDPEVKEIALLIFSSVPGVFGNEQSKYLQVIHQMICQSLTNQHSKQVQYVAVQALSSFILANEKEPQVQKQFIDCLNLLLQFFSEELNSSDGHPEDVLRHLVDLVESYPKLFRGQLDLLFQICLKGISVDGFGESCNHLSLEVFVTLCESSPAMVKKLGSKQVPIFFSVILKMMTRIEDDPNWDFEEDESDEENDSTPIVAEASLDRLACALGGKTVLPIVLQILPEMLQSPDWKNRYAGLMAISAIGEGCHKAMSSMLSEIVDGIIPFLNDLQTRVRYAACNALGQMSTDFAPTFQKKFHNKVIPALLHLLRNNCSPRVQAHAGAALVNFFEDCPKAILTPYMDNIVNVLHEMLLQVAEKGPRSVLEQVVVTLASLADSAQEKFTGYYEKFMPCLIYIIQTANQPDMRMLRGKTVECVSLIGLAVGKEKFLSDASKVMDFLLLSLSEESPMADDDPQLSYMIAAWARICKILGKAFEPYLPFVMKPVLKAASIKPEIAVLDADDVKVVENDEDWEFVNLGEKRNFGIRTAGLEEKATACQMLVCYAKELKDGFSAYSDETIKLMLPMLKFYFHDSVRIAAAEIMPYLLECSKIHGDDYLKDIWNFILEAFIQAMDNEPENEVLCEQLVAFSQCVEVLDCVCFTPAQIEALTALLNKNLSLHFQRSLEREGKRNDEDYDEVLEDTLITQDEDSVFLLSKLTDVVCTLFSIYKDAYFPYFDVICQYFVQLLQPNRSWSERQWALCVFADVIEYSGPACTKYQQYFLTPLLTCVLDVNPDLRQTAAYTLGALGQFGGQGFAQFCADSIPLLLQVISDPNSRAEENERATENAISAVTKFINYNSSLINIDEVIPLWISWLPIWEDEEEVKCVYSFLCHLLETNNALLLGKDNCNLPRIVYVIAETFLKEGIENSSELGHRIIKLVMHIKSNGEMFSICWSQLNLDQQRALDTALTAQ